MEQSSAVGRFFAARGIVIDIDGAYDQAPLLPAEAAVHSWIDALDGGPSATFWVRYPGGALEYLSGTGQTKIIVQWNSANPTALVYDLAPADSGHYQLLCEEVEQAGGRRFRDRGDLLADLAVAML